MSDSPIDTPAIPGVDTAVAQQNIRRARTRRRVTRGGVGALLIVASVIASILVHGADDGRRPVWITTRAVGVGHVLAPGDVRTVRVAADPDAGLVEATNPRTMIGRQTAVPLAAATLIGRSAVGTPIWPPRDWRLVSVKVRDGQYPSSVAAGATVEVVLNARNIDAPATEQPQSEDTPLEPMPSAAAPSPEESAAADELPNGASAGGGPVRERVTGTVVAVRRDTATTAGGAVVDLVMPTDGAVRVASAAEVALLMARP